jgi:multidrug efflux pump subunit AcrA (membrane-fusion protein)
MTAFIANKSHEWTGRIARTEGAIDAATRQVFAIAVVEDPYGKGAAEDGTPLAMGLYVDAHIVGKPYENAIVLSRSALYGRDTVYVVNDDNKLEARTVSIVSADRDTITLASGITPGERVVISPLRGADDGDEVTPTDPDSISPTLDGDNETPPLTNSTAQNTSGDNL